MVAQASCRVGRAWVPPGEFQEGLCQLELGVRRLVVVVVVVFVAVVLQAGVGGVPAVEMERRMMPLPGVQLMDLLR